MAVYVQTLLLPCERCCRAWEAPPRARKQAPFEVELVPCSGLFKVPFSWFIHCQSLLARDAIGGGRAKHHHHGTVPRQKSRASQSPAKLGRGSHPPVMPMPMSESIPTPGRPASSTPSACDRYLACRKKRPGASKVGHVWRTARVGGAETQGQLPLTDPVPKPTPDVVITCTRRVPLHDSRHELVHGTIATQCCWKLELKPWPTRLELESQRPMWRLECDGSQLWTWRDST